MCTSQTIDVSRPPVTVRGRARACAPGACVRAARAEREARGAPATAQAPLGIHTGLVDAGGKRAAAKVRTDRQTNRLPLTVATFQINNGENRTWNHFGGVEALTALALYHCMDACMRHVCCDSLSRTPCAAPRAAPHSDQRSSQVVAVPHSTHSGALNLPKGSSPAGPACAALSASMYL